MPDDIKTVKINVSSEPKVSAQDAALPVNSAPASENSSVNVESEKAEEIIVKQSDVTPEMPEQPDSQSDLAGKVELLAGEIQALEAKLEQFIGGARADAPKAEPAAKAVPVNEESKLPSDLNSNNEANPPEIRAQYAQSADEHDEGGALGMIAEVVATFGIIIFAALLLMPLWRSFVGDDLLSMISSIGWFSALGCLFVGLVLMLFIKGKVILKVILGFILLITALLYLGSISSSLIGFLESALGPVFEFYR